MSNRQQPRRLAMLGMLVMMLTLLSMAGLPERVFATSGGDAYSVPLIADTNPAPTIVETTIVAQTATVDIGQGVMAHALTFNGQIPGPEFRLNVGDTVIVHFQNNLPYPTGIHWHGIELNNASDGTPLTQNMVAPGGTFLYKFKVTRPGIFWYHPHHHGSTNQVFQGLYGSIIVTDPNEAALQAAGVLPSALQTRTLAISDITVCKTPGSNDPGEPVKICETSPIDENGSARGPSAAGDVPNIQPSGAAPPVHEGETVIANGRNVGMRAGTPAAPGALAAGASTLDVQAGQGLRFQIGNTATTRFFRLRLTDNAGTQIPLIRIGGQGGLLDNARLEGGKPSGFDFKYDAGEILLGPGERADVVVAIPVTATGVLTMWTLDFARTGSGLANIPTVPVAHLNVTGIASPLYTIAAGTPLRAAIPGASVEALGAATGIVTAQNTPGIAGDIHLTNKGNQLGVDTISGTHDFPGDYTSAPYPDSARTAELGSILELTVTNETGAHHPFHLHGFSIQPISLTDTLPGPPPSGSPDKSPGTGPSYTFPYHEFVDTIEIPGGYTLRFRVRLDDRPLMDGTTPGGGLGRWVFHCHIFFHASFGMISEFDVVSRGLPRPYINVIDRVIFVNPGDPVEGVGGTYVDTNGLGVRLSASLGSIRNLGVVDGIGRFTWNFNRTITPTPRVGLTGFAPLVEAGLNTAQAPDGFVYLTVTDTGDRKDQGAFPITINSARSLKEDVLTKIRVRLTGASRHETEKLRDIVRELEAALNPSLWLDENRLVFKRDRHRHDRGEKDELHGHHEDSERVFEKEAHAVDDLKHLMKEKKSTIPHEMLQEMVEQLVQADRILAKVALEDAIADSGRPGLIAEAKKEVDKAATAFTEGHATLAIEYYKNAWIHAHRALD